MVRKLYLIAGLYAVCVIGAVLSGCSIYDKEDMSKMIATPGDAECQADGAKNGEGDAEGKEKSGDKTEDAESNTDTDGESQGEDMTRLRDYSQISTKKYSWYIVRDKNHGMSGCDNSFPLEQYDAFYVDRVCAEKNEKVMYLTFDCGYENGYTEQMLDVLKKHNAKGCFFVTMTYIRDNPDIVKRMKEEGHQVGNHTVHHPCMPEKSVEEQKSELKECSDFMRNETGYEMDMYFRPPSGEYSEQIGRAHV